jgi:hypothetical protein
MGQPLMATPALSQGMLIVRGVKTIYALGERKTAQKYTLNVLFLRCGFLLLNHRACAGDWQVGTKHVDDAFPIAVGLFLPYC